jgi:hypothetical protein
MEFKMELLTMFILGVILLLVIGIALFVVFSPSQSGSSPSPIPPEPPIPPIPPIPPEPGSKGMLEWAVHNGNYLDSPNNTISPSIAYFDGYVYLAGVYTSTNFLINSYESNPGPESGNIILTPYGTLPGGFGVLNIFLSKYDSNGQVIWATCITGTSNQGNPNITTDMDGNIYVTGQYSSTTLTFNNFTSDPTNPGEQVDVTPYGTVGRSSASPEIFVVKYNSDGQVQWATTIIGSNNETVPNVATDANGNVYITGQYTSAPVTLRQYSSPPVGGGSIGITSVGILTRTGTNQEIFVAKYNSTGTLQWATKIVGSANESNPSLAADSDENVYVTGSYNSNPITIFNFDSLPNLPGGPFNISSYGTLTNTSSSGGDIFIIKYNINGSVQWTTNIAGADTEQYPKIALDSNNYVYVTAQYRSTSLTINDFGSVGTPISVTPYGTLDYSGGTNRDIFVVKYNSDGAAQRATSITGNSSLTDVFPTIKIDNNDNVYISGSYTQIPININNFDTPPDTPGGSINITPYGNLGSLETQGLMLIKYDSSLKTQWVTNVLGAGLSAAVAGPIESCIATDTEGHVYFAGVYNTETITLDSFESSPDPLGGDITVSASGTLSKFSNGSNFDIFLAKYS